MKRIRKPRKLVPTEHASQVAFFAWWALYAQSHKIRESLCYAIPNAGKRSFAAAAWLRSEGLKRGVCDVNLDLARGGFHGLRLEFKRPGEKPNDEQAEHLEALRAGGYNALVVWSTEEAIRVVKVYAAAPKMTAFREVYI